MATKYKRDFAGGLAMSKPWITAIALLALSVPAAARPDCDALACDEVKQAIREIEARMRAGYSRAQGERYEARLRKLKRKRSKVCR